MLPKLSVLLVVFLLLQEAVAPPVDQKKKEKDDKKAKEELDDFGLEYGRYLQQVVQALEEDKEFAKKLENITAEEIRSGRIAKELEFVKYNVRSKLDELKRIEMDRLRKLLQEQLERTELGLYRDEDGHLLNSPDGRRWRTIPNHRSGFEGGVGDGNFWLGLNRKGVKIPKHLDVENPHSFEIDDLKKLIQTATNDLEELDKQRREEFKKYEMEKEAKYRESLKNLTEEEKKETEKHHDEMIAKHKDHPSLHHPGSKPQLEQVWEEQDQMPREEFNPKTFFAFHDVNGDGHLDIEEVEAILLPEVKKLYNPNNEEDDPAEMEEEFHRMREHIFNETDKNKDHLISLEEFLQMTEQQDFQKDEGWKGLDEQSVYSEAELQEFMRQRQMEMYPHGYQQYPYADQRAYYDVNNAQQHGLPPHINYQVPPGGVPPQPGYPHGQQYGVPPQPGYPQHQMPGGHPQQHQGVPQMQQYQGGQPQQFHGQQNQAGYPQQQHYQGAPQQQFQTGHQQHPQAGQQQQFHPGQQIQPGQQQQFQPGQPQQFQGGQQQPFQAGQQQQFQAGQQQQQFQAGQQQQQQQQQQQAKPLQQGNQQFNSVPSQKVPDQKQSADKSNSINEIPNAEVKPNVPQDSIPHGSNAAQQVHKTAS